MIIFIQLQIYTFWLDLKSKSGTIRKCCRACVYPLQIYCQLSTFRKYCKSVTKTRDFLLFALFVIMCPLLSRQRCCHPFYTDHLKLASNIIYINYLCARTSYVTLQLYLLLRFDNFDLFTRWAIMPIMEPKWPEIKYSWSINPYHLSWTNNYSLNLLKPRWYLDSSKLYL